MKWFWTRCRRRQEVSLLATGAVDEKERRELESHLAACEECRTYHAEITTFATPLADWEKSFSAIQATPAARRRWAGAVQQAAAPSAIQQPFLTALWRIVWGELIRPSRYAWTGMAALWVAMLAINAQFPDHRMSGAGDRASSSQEMMQAWEEQNRVLAELTKPAFVAPAPPPNLPRPRSQAERNWEIL